MPRPHCEGLRGGASGKTPEWRAAPTVVTHTAFITPPSPLKRLLLAAPRTLAASGSCTFLPGLPVWEGPQWKMAGSDCSPRREKMGAESSCHMSKKNTLSPSGPALKACGVQGVGFKRWGVSDSG